MSLFGLKKFLFNLYLNIPGSRFILHGVKRVYQPSHRIRKYLRFKGVFKIRVEDMIFKMWNHGNTIENELFWRGAEGWEPHSTRAWKRLSEQSKVIFDVGANTGLYSLISAKSNPHAIIYAFEPVEIIFDRLNKNLELNHLKVSSHRIALAEDDGEGEIFAANTISNTFDQASLSNSKVSSGNARSIMIQKQRISTFIADQGITQIDLIKIDVETYEAKVLIGMGNYLQLFKPTLLIEILNDVVAREVEHLVAGIDYSYFLIDEKKGYVLKTNLLPPRKGCNFLLVNEIKHSVVDWLNTQKK